MEHGESRESIWLPNKRRPIVRCLGSVDKDSKAGEVEAIRRGWLKERVADDESVFNQLPVL